MIPISLPVVRPLAPPVPAAADEVLGGEVDEVDEADAFEDVELDIDVEKEEEDTEAEEVEADVIGDCEDEEGVAAEEEVEVWVAVIEAGVVEPRKVQIPSVPRGIYTNINKYLLSLKKFRNSG